METKCAPLLADLFLHSYEAVFIAVMIRNDEYRLERSFNLSYRHSGLSISFSCVATAPPYGAFISQLIRYARPCQNYADFFWTSNNKVHGTGLCCYRIEVITTLVLWSSL